MKTKPIYHQGETEMSYTPTIAMQQDLIRYMRTQVVYPATQEDLATIAEAESRHARGQVYPGEDDLCERHNRVTDNSKIRCEKHGWQWPGAWTGARA